MRETKIQFDVGAVNSITIANALNQQLLLEALSNSINHIAQMRGISARQGISQIRFVGWLNLYFLAFNNNRHLVIFDILLEFPLRALDFKLISGNSNRDASRQGNWLFGDSWHVRGKK